MKFNRQLKEILPRPYPAGYQAPSTALFNVDQVDTSLGALEAIVIKPWDEGLIKYIDLILDVLPEEISAPDITVTLAGEENAFEPVCLYENKGLVKSIRFLWSGSGLCFDAIGEDPQDLKMYLQQKQLALENQSWLFQFFYQDKSFTYQQLKGEQGVWAYGGLYTPETEWHAVMQSFFTLSANDEQTAITISALTLWHEQGLHPPTSTFYEGREICFQGPHAEEPYKSVLDFISESGFVLKLRPENSKETELVKEYYSTSLRRLGPTQVLIRFKH